MSPWDEQGMAGVDRMGVEDADERAILEDERVGNAACNSAEITISVQRGTAHETYRSLAIRL
jgi:hypothetical protein